MCCPSLLCAPDWINFSKVIRLKNRQLASGRAVAAIVRCVEHSVGEPLQCQVSILMQKFFSIIPSDEKSRKIFLVPGLKTVLAEKNSPC